MGAEHERALAATPSDDGRVIRADGGARRSPPTERVVQVLDFLAQRPQDRYTVSDLARVLQISRPTCLGIVTTLTAAGYIDRDPTTKTYALGPALIQLGRAAGEGFLPLEPIRRHLDDLAERTGVTAAALAHTGRNYLVVDRAGPPCRYDPILNPGQRLPVTFRHGKSIMAWYDDDTIARWLAAQAADEAATADELAEFRAVVAFARTNGYLISTYDRDSLLFQDLLAAFGMGSLPHRALEFSRAAPTFLLDTRLSRVSYGIGGIMAVVPTDAPRSRLLVWAGLVDPAVPAARVRSCVRTLLEVAEDLAAELGERIAPKARRAVGPA